MIKRFCFVAMVLVLSAAVATAGEIGGVNLPETLSVDGNSLVLNGAGLRKKLFIKVYAGGLYLLQKGTDAAALIAADAPMAVRMHFIYDGVSSEKLIEAWNEGFAATTGGKTTPLQDRIDRFNGYFTEEAKKGDVYDMVYLPGRGVTVQIKGQARGTVEGLDFKQALFGIWLGEKPVDNGLKAGMLGQ